MVRLHNHGPLLSNVFGAHSFRGLESMTIVAEKYGVRQAGMAGIAVAESLHPELRVSPRQRAPTGNGRDF